MIKYMRNNKKKTERERAVEQRSDTVNSACTACIAPNNIIIIIPSAKAGGGKTLYCTANSIHQSDRTNKRTKKRTEQTANQ